MKRLNIATLLILAAAWMGNATVAWGQETAGTLQSQLDAFSNQAKQQFPAEMWKSMESAIDQIRDSDLLENARNVGDQAIDATLKDAAGNSIHLKEAWSKGPVVLQWYRGGWCPYCNLQLQALAKHAKALESTGTQLLVISPELPENATNTQDRNKLPFRVLHDPRNELAKKYGLVFEIPESLQPLYRDRIGLAKVNGDDSMQLPMPASYVIDTQGTIRYAFLDEDYKKRSEPTEIVAAVRKIVGPPEVGQSISDFQLPNLQGELTSLSDLVSSGPVVFVMLRGFPGYQCPLCSRQVGQLVSKAKAIQDAGAQVVMVYPGPANSDSFQLEGKAKEFLKDTRLPEGFHLLVDADYQVTNLYGLRWDATRETAYPSTLVVNREGKIVFAKISQSHGDRSDVGEVLKAIQEAR